MTSRLKKNQPDHILNVGTASFSPGLWHMTRDMVDSEHHSEHSACQSEHREDRKYAGCKDAKRRAYNRPHTCKHISITYTHYNMHLKMICSITVKGYTRSDNWQSVYSDTPFDVSVTYKPCSKLHILTWIKNVTNIKSGIWWTLLFHSYQEAFTQFELVILSILISIHEHFFLTCHLSAAWSHFSHLCSLKGRRMCSAEAADRSQKSGERLTMTHGKTEEYLKQKEQSLVDRRRGEGASVCPTASIHAVWLYANMKQLTCRKMSNIGVYFPSYLQKTTIGHIRNSVMLLIVACGCKCLQMTDWQTEYIRECFAVWTILPIKRVTASQFSWFIYILMRHISPLQL